MARIALGLSPELRQEEMGARQLAGLGTLVFLDSVNGRDGNDGLSRQHAVQTLARALAIAQAGDTVLLDPGGSETVTATVAISTAGVRLICPVEDPRHGFTISGAGTLDLVTVSAARVKLEGLRLAHTGATANQAGVLTTNAADKLHVKRCMFDDSAITATWTGIGVEVVNACDDVKIEDSLFLDQQFGVLFTMATGVVCSRPMIRGCTFYTGRASAFSISTALTGTGAVKGPLVVENLFFEALGDGSVATEAWNGSNNTDATRGPIKFEAAVDQYLVVNNRAYTALAQAFDTINAVNAGAAGDFATNATGVGGDTSSAVDSVGTQVSSALSATVSHGVATSTGLSSALSATVSYGVAGSTANSTTLSAVVSFATLNSTSLSTIVSKIDSVGAL